MIDDFFFRLDNLAHDIVNKPFLSLLSQIDAEKSRWIPVFL